MDIPNNSFIVIGKSCFYILLAKKKYPIGGELTLHLFSSQKKTPIWEELRLGWIIGGPNNIGKEKGKIERI